MSNFFIFEAIRNAFKQEVDHDVYMRICSLTHAKQETLLVNVICSDVDELCSGEPGYFLNLLIANDIQWENINNDFPEE